MQKLNKTEKKGSKQFGFYTFGQFLVDQQFGHINLLIFAVLIIKPSVCYVKYFFFFVLSKAHEIYFICTGQ